jgi:FkbM family methyltransferase
VICETPCRVIALEPDPRFFSKLVANIAWNRCEHVTALPYAAAARDGSLFFELCAQSGSNFGLSRVATDRVAEGDQIEVPARTLDVVLDELDLATVHLLKMDIEGAEGFALAGLQRSLSAHRILRVLLELHPTALKEYGYRVEEVFEHLASAGYRGQVIDHSRKATRRTAYGKTHHVDELLRSIVPTEPLDPWPHLLWTCD